MKIRSALLVGLLTLGACADPVLSQDAVDKVSVGMTLPEAQNALGVPCKLISTLDFRPIDPDPNHVITVYTCQVSQGDGHFVALTFSGDKLTSKETHL